jgi:Ribbon-helix-helix protein, copG family
MPPIATAPGHCVFRIGGEIGDVDRLSFERNALGDAAAAGREGHRPQHLIPFAIERESRAEAVEVAAADRERRLAGIAQPRGRLHQGVEHRLEVEGRAADDLEHVARRGLVFERFLELAGALTQFAEEASIVQCNHRLSYQRLVTLDGALVEHSLEHRDPLPEIGLRIVGHRLGLPATLRRDDTRPPAALPAGVQDRHGKIPCVKPPPVARRNGFGYPRRHCCLASQALMLVRRFARGLLTSASSGRSRVLTYVSCNHKVTYMEKTQVYLPREELEALRAAAARSGRSVAELIREAVRKTVLKPRSAGPVALWDGEPKRTSIEHDSVHDEP